MKNILVFISLVLLASACKESNPPIDFGKPGTILLSQEYSQLATEDLPDEDYRGILIEDLTGVRCVACPNAAKAAKAIKDSEGNNPVVILGLYTTFPKSLTFPYDDFMDMTTETAQLIGTNIYNFSNQLPAGGVNRKVYNGESSENIPFSTWQNRAQSFEDEKAIVNLDLEQEQKDDSTFIFTCKSTFTSDPDEKPFLTLFLIEDDITHPQKNTSGTDSAYIHGHVVRYEITPYNGSPLEFDGSSSAQKGSEFEVVWQVQIPDNIDKSKASLVALVNYNADNNKEVIQCREVHLK